MCILNFLLNNNWVACKSIVFFFEFLKLNMLLIHLLYVVFHWFFVVIFFFLSKIRGNLKGRERHTNLAICKFIEFWVFYPQKVFCLLVYVMSFFYLVDLSFHSFTCWINVLSQTQHLWSIVNSWRIVWWIEFCFLYLSFAFCHFIVLWSHTKMSSL